MAVTAVAADVATWLDTDEIDADLLDRVFAAAVSILGDDYDLADAEPDRADWAVTQYAARLYRRRYSIGGIETANDFGPLRVAVSDPDIHKALARWEFVRFA